MLTVRGQRAIIIFSLSSLCVLGLELKSPGLMTGTSTLNISMAKMNRIKVSLFKNVTKIPLLQLNNNSLITSNLKSI